MYISDRCKLLFSPQYFIYLINIMHPLSNSNHVTLTTTVSMLKVNPLHLFADNRRVKLKYLPDIINKKYVLVEKLAKPNS